MNNQNTQPNRKEEKGRLSKPAFILIILLIIVLLGGAITLLCLKSNFKKPFFVSADTLTEPYVTYSGKNLFNLNSTYEKGLVNYELLSDTLKLTALNSYNVYCRQKIYLTSGTYTMSCMSNNSGNGNNGILIVDDTISTTIASGSTPANSPNIDKNISVTFNISVAKLVRVDFWISITGSLTLSGDICTFKNIQLEIGDKSTVYEPYTVQSPFLISRVYSSQVSSFESSNSYYNYFASCTGDISNLQNKSVIFKCGYDNILSSNNGKYTFIFSKIQGISSIDIDVYSTDDFLLYNYSLLSNVRESIFTINTHLTTCKIVFTFNTDPDYDNYSGWFVGIDNPLIFRYSFYNAYTDGYNEGYNFVQTLDPYTLGYNDCEDLLQPQIDELTISFNQITNAYQSQSDTLNAQIDNDLTVGNMFTTILTAPYNMIKEGLNLTDPIFGINLASAVLFVISISLVFFLIKKLR